MRLVYTQHARIRMARRGLSQADIEAIVAHPLRVRRSRTTGETLYYGRVQGQTVIVVVARGSVLPRVITVWTS